MHHIDVLFSYDYRSNPLILSVEFGTALPKGPEWDLYLNPGATVCVFVTLKLNKSLETRFVMNRACLNNFIIIVDITVVLECNSLF